MIRLASREQAREIDRRTIQNVGISSAVLMERAGTLMAQWIASQYGAYKNQEIWIFWGPGNNGGDGKIIAEKLTQLGFGQIVLKDALDPQSPSLLVEKRESIKLIVDAIYGTGLTRELSEEVAALVKAINSLDCVRVSVDVPTGLDCNRGVVLGEVIRAHVTLTVGIPKKGFFINQGPSSCGRIITLDIGFPRSLVKEVAHDSFLFTKKDAVRNLPKRKISDNKTKVGRVAILGGSADMPGAAVLTGTAAMRAGAGYVILCSEQSNPLWPADFLRWNSGALVKLLDSFRSKQSPSVMAIGPGLGKDPWAINAVEFILNSGHPRVVVDADALRILATLSTEKKWPSTWILTPHAGELEFILRAKNFTERSFSAAEIENDRFYWCRAAANFLGCWVLLKGFRTIVSDGQNCIVIATGNPALAKSGTGDVLTGIIAALLAQGLSPGSAALTAATLHGWMADVWIRSGRDPLSLMASDLVGFLPKALAQFRSSTP